MTKKDFVRRITDELDRPHIETMQIVQKTLDTIHQRPGRRRSHRITELRRLRGEEAEAQEGQESKDRREGHGR